MITDFIIAFIFISLNLIMFLNSYNLINYYEKYISNIDKIILSIILFFAKIYIILFILGITGLLNFEFVLICVVIIEIINSYVYLKKKALKFPEICFNYSVIFKEPLLFVVITIVFSIYIYSFLKGFIFPPKDWDSIMYHLPAVVNWLKTESLFSTQTPFGYYPLSGALLSLWLIIPFNNDVLANCQNLLPLILCLFVMYEVNKFFVEKEWNLWIIISLFSIFIIRYELHTQLNDVLILTFFCAALYGIFKHQKTGKVIFIIITGISLGILLGLKYNMVAFSVMIFFPFFIKDKRSSIISKLKYVLIVSVLCIIFGGFWYIRNWIFLGSPIYPLSLSIGDIEIFHATVNEKMLNYVDISSSTLLANVYKPEMWYYIFMNIAKAGILYIILILLIIVSLFKVFRRINLNINFLFILLLYYCIIVFMTPTVAESEKGTLDLIKEYNNIIRYGLIGFYLILLIGIYFLSKIEKQRYEQFIKITIAVSSLTAIFFSLPDFLVKYNGLILFIFFILSLSILSLLSLVKIRKVNIKSILIIIVFSSVFLLLLKHYKDTYRGELYNKYYSKQIGIYNKSTDLFNWYYENIQNKNVMVFGSGMRCYPFFGIDFENDILFANENSDLDSADFIVLTRNYPIPYSENYGELPEVHKSLVSNINFRLVYSDEYANVYKNQNTDE